MKDKIKALLEKEGDICFKCGQSLTDENICVEHILPISLGGSDDLSNLKLICRNCNARYRNLHFSEFEFERFIFEILRRRDDFRNVILDKRVSRDYVVDIVADRKKLKNWEKLAIEIKTTTSLTIRRIHFVIERFRELKKVMGDEVRCILIFPGNLTQRSRMLFRRNDIEVWDGEYLITKFKKEIIEINHPVFNSLLNHNFQSFKKKEQLFIDRLKKCKMGRDNWSEYQKLIGEILNFLFCPPLLAPLTEVTDVFKVNRRDFIFPNYCDTGFWAFLRSRYSADYIVVDAKNYSKKVTKKEVLQIANYLKYHGTGLFGIIITRNGINESAFYTLREVWMMEKKLIIILQDDDIEQMLLEKLSGRDPENIIRQKIEDFRLSL